MREVTGSGDNPRIVEYLQSTTLDAPKASQDETPWCSAFANWCVERAGHAGTEFGVGAVVASVGVWQRMSHARAASWCWIAARGPATWASFVKSTASEIRLLGGNQSDRVWESSYPRERLMGYRLPA